MQAKPTGRGPTTAQKLQRAGDANYLDLSTLQETNIELNGAGRHVRELKITLAQMKQNK